MIIRKLRKLRKFPVSHKVSRLGRKLSLKTSGSEMLLCDQVSQKQQISRCIEGQKKKKKKKRRRKKEKKEEEANMFYKKRLAGGVNN